MKKQLKKFVIRKFIFAQTAKEALQKESKVQADECWIDADWAKDNPQSESKPIKGF